MKYKADSEIKIRERPIGLPHPTYFIADIAANHDGDLERAKELIWLAAECGADAAKFQHFGAESIVSDYGFKSLGNQQSHQAAWEESVFEVYQAASVDLNWTATLQTTCVEAGIEFFTSPYDLDRVDYVDPFVAAYKIGSGDITWHEIIRHIASKKKPVILASGASTADEVVSAVEVALNVNSQLALLQCNTNYTGLAENMRNVQLNVLRTYREMFPGMVLGLSDHTPGHATVLGAIALGARIIEKHFTDDITRSGPDHQFSMNPVAWRDMMDRSRELENALGSGVKQVEDNERETVVLQRRAIRFARSVQAGQRLSSKDLEVLRPCPSDALPPHQMDRVVGREIRVAKEAGDYLRFSELD